MIFVRAPLRITLGGGGTDLPDWYRQYGGFLVSATINKYIYFTGSERPFDKKLWLSYSKVEVCEKVEEVKHDLLRMCLGKYELANGVELHSISEVPGSSGLGSSGSFLVGALTVLNSLKKVEMTRTQLAETACRIEMTELGRSSGKQDQYISAFGGICAMSINSGGQVEVQPVDISPIQARQLENNLLIYYTGVTRDANEILSEQNKSFANRSEQSITMMREIQEIGFKSRDAILAGNFDRLGSLMHDHWNAKRKISTKMSTSALDQIYDFAFENGALGGKIMGAGGGGYWMFYVPADRQTHFRKQMQSQGVTEMLWSFDFNGCQIVYSK